MPQAINWQQDKRQRNVDGKTRSTYIRIKRITQQEWQHIPSFSLTIRIINSRLRQCSQLKLYVNDLQKLILLWRCEYYLLIIPISSCEVNEEKWDKTSTVVPVFYLCCNLHSHLVTFDYLFRRNCFPYTKQIVNFFIKNKILLRNLNRIIFYNL